MRRCPACRGGPRTVRDRGPIRICPASVSKPSARQGAGRTLARGYGPRPVLIPAWLCGRGDGPCQWRGDSAFASPGGIRKRDPRFPRPSGTVPCRPAGPGPAEGQRPPPAGQGSAWRCRRGDGPCQDAQGARRRKRFPLFGQAAPAAGTSFSTRLEPFAGAQRGTDGAIVQIVQLAADRHALGQRCHANTALCQGIGNVMAGRGPFDRGVQRQDHF